jgi:hypothetical protein
VLQEQTIKTGRNLLCNTCVARAYHKTGINTLCNTCIARAEIKTGRNTLCKYLCLQKQKFKTEIILKFKVEIQSLKSEFDQRN